MYVHKDKCRLRVELSGKKNLQITVDNNNNNCAFLHFLFIIQSQCFNLVTATLSNAEK